MRIYIHTPSWSVSKGNTDLKLRKQLQSIQDNFRNLEVFIPKSIASGLQFNITYVYNNISNRFKSLFKIKTSTYKIDRFSISNFNLKTYKPNVIISQGFFPKKVANIPIIWEIFFIDPNSFLISPTSDDINIWNTKIEKVRELAKLTSIVGVRDFYSIELFKKTYPEYAEKVRILPYYLPNIEPVDISIIKNKHSRRNKMKVLFVGGQANRKGLPAIIEAFKIVYKKYDKNISLDIVSNMSDGKIEIPDYLPINFHGPLNNDKVLELFEQAHIYLMPSKIETFGISYIEGFANGCVVIARDLQPQRDMLNFGECGILVPPLDYEKIAFEIMNLFENKEKCLSLAINGWDKFKNTYYWPVVGSFWVNAFNDATIK